jgi:hypothetical protein
MSGRSLRAAIDAKCKSCIYDPDGGNGTWREQVSACSSANCPLHPFRPFSRPKTRERVLEPMGQRAEPVLRPHGSENGLPGRTVGQSEGGGA